MDPRFIFSALGWRALPGCYSCGRHCRQAHISGAGRGTAVSAVASKQKTVEGGLRSLTKSSPLAGTFDSVVHASQTLAATDRAGGGLPILCLPCLNAAKFEITSKRADDELRGYLAMMSDRLRFRARAVEDIGDTITKANFRLLA
jgi:hypothetical protein